LPLGNRIYNRQELQSILEQPERGQGRPNGLVLLAHQEIAAKLNIANGANGSCIEQTLAGADALIGDLVVPPIGNGFLRDHDVAGYVQPLRQYNDGHLCSPHCEPTPQPVSTPPPRPRPTPAPRT
jgi:hypothetical protein